MEDALKEVNRRSTESQMEPISTQNTDDLGVRHQLKSEEDISNKRYFT